MTSWTLFSSVQDILIQYYFGTHLAFGVFVMAVILVWFLTLGISLKYAVLFILPLVGGLTLGGFFGVATWVMDLLLVFIGLLYGLVVTRFVE